MKTQYPMIPFPLIVKATDGDTEAINQILHHYRGYITKRSLRLMKDEYGNQSMVVDEVLRGLLGCPWQEEHFRSACQACRDAV